MSKSAGIVDNSFYYKVDAQTLAIQYGKPLEYVVECLQKHRVEVLPRFRCAGDGFDAFYSDMTAEYDDTPSMTKQEFTAEVDINNIVKRFINSGGDPSSLPFTDLKAKYGDFTMLPDSYQDSLNFVLEAKAEFMKLPAEQRAKFHNNPQEFLDFVSDEKNVDALIEMGFAVKNDSNAPSDTDRIVSAIEASNARSSSKKAVKSLLERMSKQVDGDDGDD